MNFAIVENDNNDLEKLVGFIEKFFKANSTAKDHILKIDSYINGYDFLECGKFYDAVFMDIDMPGLNGLEVSYELRKIDRDVPIIFVTNMAQCAIDGYRVKALDFCLKPVTYPDVQIILEEIMDTVSKNVEDKYFVITSNGTAIKINQKDIETIEMDGHNALFRYYQGGKIKEILFRISMKDILKNIECDSLIPSSSGSIVNLAYVVAYDKVNVMCTLKSGRTISISRSHKKDFMIKLSRY